MERGLKERLVGAVILVAIIVALVPEMLSGPSRDHDGTVGGDADTGAAQDERRTYVIDLTSATRPAVSESPAVEAPVESSAPAEEGGEGEARKPAAANREAPAVPAPEVARSAAAAKAETARVETGWAVQLGSFASRDNAERLVADLRNKGYRAFVSRFESANTVRHRVRVGPEQDRARAEALAQRLRRDGQTVSVVAHP